jgi:site-specific DNA recombinase
VIIAKLDRLTRSVKDLCSLLELFEKRGVALVSVAESLDTASAAGRLVVTIIAPVSQWEWEAIGERTRDALWQKRRRGERVGNIRFGFRLSPDGKHVEPDPGEQGVLTEIRHLRQSGHTLRGIAASLNRQSLRTRRGSAWRLEHVARIIKQATGPLADLEIIGTWPGAWADSGEGFVRAPHVLALVPTTPNPTT